MGMECLYCNTELDSARKKYCDKSCKNKSDNRKYQNYQCQQARALSRKIDAINERGGGCSICGYNKNLAALNFHHLRDKKFTVDMRSFSNNSMDIISSEISKCILLCANCHMETHYGNLSDLL